MSTTWIPISGIVPQATKDGNQANGMVWKFYEVGTVTPLAVATDSTGGTLTTEFLLNTQGLATLSTVVVEPHVNSAYKIVLYLNQVDADADDTGSAFYILDNISLGNAFKNIHASYDNLADALAGPDLAGSFVEWAEYTSGKGVGGGRGQVVVANPGFNLINPLKSDGNYIELILDSALKVSQAGALGDDTTDNSSAIQECIDYAGQTSVSLQDGKARIFFESGTYLVDTPLFVTTVGNKSIIFEGASKYTAVIKAGPNLASAAKPAMTGGVYSIVLDHPPIMAWNITTGCEIHDLGFEGDDENVYGLYLNESFFSNLTRVRISGCNKRPYTGVRQQVCTFLDFSYISCGQGGVGFDGSFLLYDTSALTFTSFNSERIGTSRHAFEIFQPNNKGGWTFISPWLETASTGDAENNIPALGFMSVGGRHGNVISPYQSYANNVAGHNIYDFKEATDTLATDGITMTTDKAGSWNVEINDVSGNTQDITMGSDCTQNSISGFFDSANVVDNSASDNGNSYQPSAFGDLSNYQSVAGGFRINKLATLTGLPIGTNDYIALFNEFNLLLFGNPNNKITLNSGILEFHSNLDMRLKPASGQTLSIQITGGGNFLASGLPTSDPGGSNIIWNNSGVLNIT